MDGSVTARNLGVVVAVRGSVVDVRFDVRLPPIFSLLRTGARNDVLMEVLAQRDAHHVRAIALTPTQGLARGMSVEDTEGPLIHRMQATLLRSAVEERHQISVDIRGRSSVLGTVRSRSSWQRRLPYSSATGYRRREASLAISRLGRH